MVQSYLPGGVNVPTWEGTLAPPGEYDWTCAHPSPQPKQQIDGFSRFCTAHDRKSLYFTVSAPFPQNCPFPRGLWTPCKTWLLGPIRAHRPNGISIVSAVFAQMTAECPYTLQWDAPCPPQNCPFPSNTWFLGPPVSSTQMASRSVQPF